MGMNGPQLRSTEQELQRELQLSRQVDGPQPHVRPGHRGGPPGDRTQNPQIKSSQFRGSARCGRDCLGTSQRFTACCDGRRSQANCNGNCNSTAAGRGDIPARQAGGEPAAVGELTAVWETITTGRLGFGSSPVRTTGPWLWPGTTGPDAVGPSGHVATTDANRPNGRNALRGLVSHYRTKRGAIRWAASVDGDPATEARDGFRFVRAAARWLAGRLTGGAVAEPDGGPDAAGRGQ